MFCLFYFFSYYCLIFSYVDMRFFVKKKIIQNLRLPLYNLRLPLYFVYVYFWIYMLKFLCTIIQKKKKKNILHSSVLPEYDGVLVPHKKK